MSLNNSYLPVLFGEAINTAHPKEPNPGQMTSRPVLFTESVAHRTASRV